MALTAEQETFVTQMFDVLVTSGGFTGTEFATFYGLSYQEVQNNAAPAVNGTQFGQLVHTFYNAVIASGMSAADVELWMKLAKLNADLIAVRAEINNLREQFDSDEQSFSTNVTAKEAEEQTIQNQIDSLIGS